MCCIDSCTGGLTHHCIITSSFIIIIIVHHHSSHMYNNNNNNNDNNYSKITMNMMLSNTSQVDVENVDTERFPNFSEIPYMECILEPGEMLYIPIHFWHYVKSLEISFSVSFWWL